MKLSGRLFVPVYMAVLVGAGAILRFPTITRASIWHDEGYTMMLATQGLIEIVARTARDVHPPLYYLALHAWIWVFGTGEAAVRGFSAICMLAIIPLAYLLVRRLYSEGAARIAALFVATGPFLIRYSQEARMYGMTALLVTAATYALVRAHQDKDRRWWVLYAILVAACLYTHYFSVFMILAHWLYMIAGTSRRPAVGLYDRWFWFANAGALALFLPWLPVAANQFRRVQTAFWILPSDRETLPNTLLQFLDFSSHHEWAFTFRALIAAAFVALVAVLWVTAKTTRPATVLLGASAMAAPLLVFTVSELAGRPLYVDRYFVFASVFVYMLLGVLVAKMWPLWRLPAIARAGLAAAVVVLFLHGSQYVYGAQGHRMRDAAAVVNQGFQSGDVIVSGELYTYFDFSYYNRTGSEAIIYIPWGATGYGESSLFHERINQVVVRQLDQVRSESGRVWLIGKGGDKPYYAAIPSTWQAEGPRRVYAETTVQLFRVP